MLRYCPINPRLSFVPPGSLVDVHGMETRHETLYAKVIPRRSKLKRFEYLRHEWLKDPAKTEFNPKIEGCRACKAECPIQRQTMRRILGLVKKANTETALGLLA